MEVEGDVEGVRYVEQTTTQPTPIQLHFPGLALDIKITATLGEVSYKSWVTSEDYTWTKEQEEGGTDYVLEVKQLTGTGEQTMTFVTSRDSPAEYKPTKDLGHSITKDLKIKFFSKSYPSCWI